jgi:putative ubiquitin-RnfH superfamily antitoxin RatB of RatAB toxin-antitoxin module
MGRDEAWVVVEVVYAEPARQMLCKVALPPGSTVQDAIERAGIVPPTMDLGNCKVGVFGKSCARDALVRDGDRVEIYRTLLADPKTARRVRAGRTRPARESG